MLDILLLEYNILFVVVYKNMGYKEALMKINNELKQQAVDYSMDSIKQICETIGPRSRGSRRTKMSRMDKRNSKTKNGLILQNRAFKMARCGLLSFGPVIEHLMMIAAIFK